MVDIAAEPSKTAPERASKRCSALNRFGQPCGSRAVSGGNLCAAHSGRTNMRAIGRVGGMARKPRKALRDILREEIDPALIVEALRSGLKSGREADRIAASRLILLELFESPKAEPPPGPEAEFDPSLLTKTETRELAKLLEKAKTNGDAKA